MASLPSYRVVIVGGGISGLATAWGIRQRLSNAETIVLEKQAHPGGTAWTEFQDGFQLETGPNGFLDNKTSTLELCRKLGLESELVQAAPAAQRRYLFLGDQLRALPTTPAEFLRSGLIGWGSKLRLFLEPWIPRGTVSDESIYDFGQRRLGRGLTEVFLDAFVTGILAGDSRLLSLPACFPRIAELEREYGSLLRAQKQLARQRRRQAAESRSPSQVGGPGGTLTTLRGGMRTLMEALGRNLGPAFFGQTAAEKIEPTKDGNWFIGGGSRSWEADAVVLACPAYTQAELLAPVDGPLSRELADIPYTRAIVAVVGYPRSALPAEAADAANGFGYLTPQRLGRPVLGVIFSGSIFPDQAPEGQIPFRAILGGWQRGDVLDWSEDQIVAAVGADLQATLGIRGAPSFTWIHRWPRAIPQYHVGHLERLRHIDAMLVRHPGLYLTGNAFRGVALNDCTLDADRTAARVVEYLTGCSAPKSSL